MTTVKVVDTLRDNYFLAGMSESELQWIASVARLEKFAPEAVIFQEGEEDTGVFLVVEGSVSLEICVPGTEPAASDNRAGRSCSAGRALGDGPMTAGTGDAGAAGWPGSRLLGCAASTRNWASR
jgi:hypothetical protein